MQLVFLALLASGASAATLHDLSDRLPVPPGDRTPVNLAQMSELMKAESAALPEVQRMPQDQKEQVEQQALDIQSAKNAQDKVAGEETAVAIENEKKEAQEAKEKFQAGWEDLNIGSILGSDGEERYRDAMGKFWHSDIAKALTDERKKLADSQENWKKEWQQSMPKPKEQMPNFEGPNAARDKKIWEAEQGDRILQGTPGGDLANALNGLKKINDRAQAKIIKTFGFLEKKADVQVGDAKQKSQAEEAKAQTKVAKEDKAQTKAKVKQEPTKEEQKADKEAEAMGESIVAEPKSARQAETKEAEDAGGWDITFCVLLAACVFVFGWWAIKVGWHERAAEALSEFAFQCKKTLSTLLKGGSHNRMEDEKSESSYSASEGSEGSGSSKGALNSHLQGVIDRVRGNLGSSTADSSSDSTRK